MQFKSPLITGVLVKRYKRFFADVELADGSVVTAHCPNTGAMTGCAEPGYKVWIEPVNDPKRKLKYSWQIAENHLHHRIGINTHNANKVVSEALSVRKITELGAYSSYQAEVKYGVENSKIDFLLSYPEDKKLYLEVKSVTLLQNGMGYFPDAVTTRGQKHLRELMSVIEHGDDAGILFCVQHTGIDRVRAAAHIDSDYAELLQQAKSVGVKLLAYSCEITPQKIVIDRALPIEL